jgi:hypothetical protein
LQGNGGTVVRNSTGFMLQQQVPLNLTALLPGAPGWHKLTVQGKAVDPVTNAVQTGECRHKGAVRCN